jgi:flagellar biogenesis protein FliO
MVADDLSIPRGGPQSFPQSNGAPPRALRVCETLPLGDRRFLMVVQFEQRRFLVGATNHSISLLERLDERGHPLQESQEPRWSDSLWKRPH